MNGDFDLMKDQMCSLERLLDLEEEVPGYANHSTDVKEDLIKLLNKNVYIWSYISV